MADIESSYLPGGGLQTTTAFPGGAMPGGGGFPGLPFDPIALMEYKLKQQAAQQAFENAMRERAMRMQEQQMRQARMMAQPQMPQAQERPSMPAAGYRGPQPYGPTSRQFGRWSMTPQGIAGTYVDPMDVPAGLREQIMTGFAPSGAAQQQYTYSTPFQARPSNAAPFGVAGGGVDPREQIQAALSAEELGQRRQMMPDQRSDWGSLMSYGKYAPIEGATKSIWG